MMTVWLSEKCWNVRCFRRNVGLVLLLTIFYAGIAGAEERLLNEIGTPDDRLRARWTVSPTEPRLSDMILLRLELDMKPGVRAEMPEFGADLGDLEIVEQSESPVAVEGDREKRRLLLKTRPRQGGTTKIWPTTIRYRAESAESGVPVQTLTLPATELKIRADVTPEDASLDNVTGRPDLLETTSRNLLPFLLSGLAVVILLLILLLRRRLRHWENADPLVRMSSQEIALQRLGHLVDSRLHEEDVKRFFMELTGIVRWYIEDRTGIRAPERTTEEFLREISIRWKHDGMTDQLRDRLRLFLESADRVKFAKFRPTMDEVMLGVRRAEEFIRHWESTEMP